MDGKSPLLTQKAREKWGTRHFRSALIGSQCRQTWNPSRRKARRLGQPLPLLRMGNPRSDGYSAFGISDGSV
jgi:hypothetical protein